MDEDAEWVVVPRRSQIEIYPNKGGSITIKSDGDFSREDHVIVIEPSDVEAIVRGLRAAKKAL